MAEGQSAEYVASRCPQCGAGLPPGQEQVLCAYCGTWLIRRQDAAGQAEPAYVQGLRLKPLVCMDTQGLGIEALRLLMPVGWEFNGGVYWPMDNPAMPAVIAFQVYNPAGHEALEVLPNLAFYWTTNPMTLMTCPPGSRYFGNEVRPPVGAVQALCEVVVPRFRGRVPGVRVVRQEPLPELARAVGAGAAVAGGTTWADSARIRLCYTWGGNAIEEDLYGVVEVTRVPVPALFGMAENIFWMVDYLFSCRAAAGRLDGLADLFRVLAHSIRLNPQWHVRCQQVIQYLVQNQIQHIRNIGQISRMISQTAAEAREDQLASYYHRQQVMDRLATDWSQTIRGVDEYHNPFEGRPVELPAGYRQAWVNNLGEYILSDDLNYNPNIGSNLHWEPMQRR